MIRDAVKAQDLAQRLSANVSARLQEKYDNAK